MSQNDRSFFIIDLFSGANSWTKPWREVTSEIISVDILPDVSPVICMDILEMNNYVINQIISEIPEGAIVVLYASPPCTAFSVASIGHHWKKDPVFIPQTEAAEKSIRIIRKMNEIIHKIDPDYFWIENPRGVLRKLGLMPDYYNHAEVWYCQYGDDRAKPTDLWGKWPKTWVPRPKCSNGATARGECHHTPAPRGAKTGTQGRNGWLLRSQIPQELVIETKEAVMNESQDNS